MTERPSTYPNWMPLPAAPALASVKTNVGSSDEQGGAAKCQSCLGTGKCAKAAILPEPPDVQCPTCRGTGKGGAERRGFAEVGGMNLRVTL